MYLTLFPSLIIKKSLVTREIIDTCCSFTHRHIKGKNKEKRKTDSSSPSFIESTCMHDINTGVGTSPLSSCARAMKGGLVPASIYVRVYAMEGGTG